MIRCLVNKSLEFSKGSEKAKTVVGFCQLPNWVVKDPFFKAAVKEGSVKPFEGTSDKIQEQILKDEEKATALKAEIAELETKKISLSNKAKSQAKESTKK